MSIPRLSDNGTAAAISSSQWNTLASITPGTTWTLRDVVNIGIKDGSDNTLGSTSIIQMSTPISGGTYVLSFCTGATLTGVQSETTEMIFTVSSGILLYPSQAACEAVTTNNCSGFMTFQAPDTITFDSIGGGYIGSPGDTLYGFGMTFTS